jgi:predicted GH43/DUF377 family glycosyl hydrolase
MRVSVNRKNIKFLPDSSRVIARFFLSSDERIVAMIGRIMSLEEKQVSLMLEQTLREFASRHRNISRIFLKHCNRIQELIESMQINFEDISIDRKMLIGSYYTMEYAIESAAFFNPSIIKDFDQSFLQEGEKRVILSFRATGEGHVSSVVFRRAILDKNNDLQLMKVGEHVDMAEFTQNNIYSKKILLQQMKEREVPEEYFTSLFDDFPDELDYISLRNAISRVNGDVTISGKKKKAFEEMGWILDSYYDVQFHRDSDISERVLFPISLSESNGIEDARFVNFVDDDGSEKTYATYTAFTGYSFAPKLLSTDDFYTFRLFRLTGNGAQNKNLALFPKKINGQYAMLARIDGVNNYLMYSDSITEWKNPVVIQEPKFPWEFTQLGNCGSPLWTEEGWLVISHGVGPMRRYCIGASLFDLDDPSKEIGRLKEPLLSPQENERDGYVPNVVYSCGAIIHNENLILPYAVSDYSSTYAVIDMKELFNSLKK